MPPAEGLAEWGTRPLPEVIAFMIEFIVIS
jgi:hypothetical protein